MPESKIKVLIVDDEKIVRDFLKRLLAFLGVEVSDVDSGAAAIELVRQKKFDLFFIDVRMPGLNGFEVCRKIRREKKDIQTPIVMLTALQDDADRLIGKVVGAQRYLTKPFKMDELLKEVEWLMPSDL